MSGPTLTWWGASSVLIRHAGASLAIDPYLHPEAADYVCLTREDWDHTHEPTLERIVSGERFEHLLAPPSCRVMSRLDAPVGDDPQDLQFVPPERLTLVEPRLARKTRRAEEPRRLGPFEVEAVASSEREQPILLDGFLMHRWRPRDGRPWPAQSGRFLGGGRFLPLGYVVTLAGSGITVYHPGDLQETFDAHRELRGRIDVMLFPSIMLEGVELTVLDNIRPRVIVPIHHRPDDASFPIPLEFDPAHAEVVDPERGLPRPGVSPEAFAQARAAMHRGHWYASVDPSLTRLHSLEPALREIGCELVLPNAGESLPLERLRSSAGG